MRGKNLCICYNSTPKYSSSSISSIGSLLVQFFMKIPRDSKGRYIRANSQNLIKIPTNLYEG